MGNAGYTVLLVEDDDLDRQVVMRCLRKSKTSYDITCAISLAEALRHLAGGSFDIILTDLNLPDTRGTESILSLADPDDDRTLIALSGNNDPALYTQALEMGADDFLEKSSIDSERLDRCIRQCLTRTRQRRDIQNLITKEKEQRKLLGDQARELVRKNERLQTLCDSATKFVNNVSHEFRTPLCVIRQYASLVADGIVGDISDEQVRLLRIIEDRVDALNTMVDDMLDGNRLQAGLLSAMRTSFPIGEFVQDVIDSLRPRAEVRGSNLILELTDDLPPVFCDGEKANRTLVNLVTNAIKFSEGKDVTVRVGNDPQATADRPAILIEVSDRGPGLEEDEVKRIFERFKQGRSATQCDARGFGLGLNIARELTDLNLGEIRVESRRGEGSTFAFTLPVDMHSGIILRHCDRLVREQASRDDLASGRDTVHLFELVGSTDFSPADVNDLSGFLNHLLRCNDLVLNEGHRWKVLANGTTLGSETFQQRLVRELEIANRNRPQGPLPAVHVCGMGHFDPANDRDQLMQRLFDVQPAGPGCTNPDDTAVEHEDADSTIDPRDRFSVDATDRRSLRSGVPA